MNILSYKWWWGKIGSLPWTYILRDAWHKFEGLCIVALVGIGVWLGHYHYEIASILFWGFVAGYIAGHLFWGKEYIPNQRQYSQSKRGE